MRRVLLILAFLHSLRPAIADEHDRWTDDAGVAPAAGEIADCLNNASPDPADRAKCIDRPFEVCQGDRDAMSVVETGQCLSFARMAWNEHLKTEVRRVEELFPPARVEHFRRSQTLWSDWNEIDCFVQAAIYEAGTFHSLAISRCELLHTTERAVELRSLADELDR